MNTGLTRGQNKNRAVANAKVRVLQRVQIAQQPVAVTRPAPPRIFQTTNVLW